MTNYSLRWYLACNPKAFALVQADFHACKGGQWYKPYHWPPFVNLANNYRHYHVN